MSLNIAQLGQPILWQAAAPVLLADITGPEFQQFLQQMRETMEQQKGVGLAAPQVFVSARVFLAAIVPSDNEDDSPGVEVFINPKIVPLTDEIDDAWEGCLSFPELLVKVPRFRAVQIEYLNAHGEPTVWELEDFPARVVQHELDHLDGILTIDRAKSARHIIKASEIETVKEQA